MFLDNFVCFSSAVVRRDVFTKVGTFDESIPLAIDYDLWLRAATVCEFDYVDDLLIEYRRGHTNLSRRTEERLDIVFKIMERFLDERGGREHLPAAIVRSGYAETHCTLAFVQRQRSTFAAFASYLRALRYKPFRFATWKAMLSLVLPEPGRVVLRRLFRQRSHGVAPVPAEST
jgi:hypothetical protein